jgi:hypothetical protein
MKQTIRIFMLLAAIVVATGQTWAQEGYDYIDANGVLKNTATDNINVTVLTGNETTLGVAGTDTWYVCNGNINYTSTLTLYGNVNIIIADDKTLSVGTADNPVNGKGINAIKNLCIFGQTNATGKIKVNNSGDYSIFVDDETLTVTYCDIDVTNTSGEGIWGDDNGVTIIGRAEGKKNTVKVNSYNRGIATDNSYLNITNCDIDITSTRSKGIEVGIGNITITGRADGSNIVEVNSRGTCIEAHDNLNITNCNIDVTSTYEYGYGIYAFNGDITITGCANGSNTVKVNSCGTCIDAHNNIYITNCNIDATSTKSNKNGLHTVTGNITIDGGQVNVKGQAAGIECYPSATITLGWRKPGDFFHVSSYNGKVHIADDKRFVTYTPGATEDDPETPVSIIKGGTTFTDPSTINGKILRAKFLTNVKYQEWDHTDPSDPNSPMGLVTKETPNNLPVWELTGIETTLGEAAGTDANNKSTDWYICTTPATETNPNGLSYDHTLNLANYCDVHLILADGAAMTVTPANGHAISSSGAGTNFSVYGQSTNPSTMGKLTATGSTGHNGIVASGNVTICGGCVTAIGICDNHNDYIGYGIDAGSITISGGQITAGKGPNSDYCWGFKATNIILGWNSATDFINCNVISEATVNTAAGKQFAAYSVNATSGAETFSNTTYGSADGSVTLDGDQVTAIGGMMLRPYNITNVDYVDADGTLKNTATDDNDDNDNITLLTGGETELGTNTTNSQIWYVVNSANLNYTRKLYLYGDVHLILADGASMTVSKNDAGGATISGGVGLTIYGQDGGTGTLTAIGKDGGYYSPGYALSSSSVTINSGRANFQDSGGYMSYGSGILATNMRINGGQVTASRGDYGSGIACNDIKIGWNRTTDFIKVDGYGGKVTIDDGQIFAAYDGYGFVDGFASGTIAYGSGDNGIDGRTLRPVDGAPLSLGSNLSLESAIRGTTVLDPTGLPTMMTVDGDTYTIYQPNDELTFKVADGYSAEGFVYVNGFPEGTTFSNVDGATSRERTFGMPAAPVRLEAVTLTEFTTPAAIDNNGTAQTPATVTGMDAVENKYTLTAGTDFTVSGMQKDGTAVSEMTEAGLYALTLTGIGPSFGTTSDVYYGIYTVDSEVPYLIWSETEKKLLTSYTLPKVKVWQLLGHETELGTDEMNSSGNPVETWYIAKGTLNFTKPITIKGPTHIILAEGDDLATMTVKVNTYGKNAFESLLGYEATGYEDLYIHAQSIDGTQGSLAVNATTGGGIQIEGDYTQNGGNVSITSDFDGFYADKVNFNGGTLNVDANKVEDNDYNHAAIYSDYGGLTINGGKLTVKSTNKGGVEVWSFTMNGGQVEVSGKEGVKGIIAYNMTIDWMNASDYIKASSYGFDVIIADGKYFTFDGIDNLAGFPVNDYAKPLRGRLSGDVINWRDDLADGPSGIIPPNTKLIPALPIVGGVPYIGYIGSRGNWALPAGIKAFVPTSYDLTNKSVTVTEVADVPNGKYVIFGDADDDNSNLPATFFLIGKESATEGGYTDPGDHFVMADGHKKISEYIEQVLGDGTSANEAVVFTLTTGAYRLVNIDGKNSGILTITSNNIPVAGQMLFIISKWELMQALKGIGGGGNSGIRQRTISIDFDGTTGIRDIEYEPSNTDPSAGAWFTLDGRKLDKAPTKKGIYIHNGKKEVVR